MAVQAVSLTAPLQSRYHCALAASRREASDTVEAGEDSGEDAELALAKEHSLLPTQASASKAEALSYMFWDSDWCAAPVHLLLVPCFRAFWLFCSTPLLVNVCFVAVHHLRHALHAA